MSRRTLAFLLIAAACFAATGAYLLHAVRRTRVPTAHQPNASGPPRLLAPGTPLSRGPALIFRHSAPDPFDGALGTAPIGEPSDVRLVPALRCDRVHMAAGRGICLASDRGVFTTYRAVLFDEMGMPRTDLPLAGLPSRTQVSPDGRLGAITVFVAGHSYAAGDFSTRTSLVDLDTGRWLVEDIETFTVRRNGRTITAPDFNVWGVTFGADGRTFYATLGTGGETLLLQGDVPTRTADVIATQVECPSLSPDGRRIAFKQRARGENGVTAWRLSVLDLATGRRQALAETRDVDDQAEWLDTSHVLYALPGTPERGTLMDQWVVPADGQGAPRLLVPGASSASVAAPAS